MALERLRNVKSGEVRDVETNSDEYVDLINEVYDHDGSARPKWEITGQHHVRRMDNDDIQEADLGYEHKPIPGATVDTSEVGPELHPERAITEAEREAGIESWEQKQAENGVAATVDNSALKNAEPLEKSDPEERLEVGRELAGSEGGKRKSSRASRKSSGSSGSAGSGSGSSSSQKETSGVGTSGGSSS